MGVLEFLYILGVSPVFGLLMLYLFDPVAFFRVLDWPVGVVSREVERWRDVRTAVAEVGLSDGHFPRFGGGVPGYVRRRMRLYFVVLFVGYAVAPTVLVVSFVAM